MRRKAPMGQGQPIHSIGTVKEGPSGGSTLREQKTSESGSAVRESLDEGKSALIKETSSMPG
jgi:hypothetical protein